MKKLQKLLTMCLAVVSALCALTACVKTPVEYNGGAMVMITVSEASSDYKAEAVIIDDDGKKTEYSLESGNEFIGDVISALQEKGLNLVVENSAYGVMIKEIGYVKPNTSNNEFIAFYTTSTNLTYSFMEMSVTVEDIEFYSCNFGIGDMPVIVGLKYLFIIGIF